MGTVDIQETVEEIVQSDKVYWDEDKFTFDEFEALIKQAVEEVTEWHYSMNDGEIDDWDVWESDVMSKVNELLGNDGGR